MTTGYIDDLTTRARVQVQSALEESLGVVGPAKKLCVTVRFGIVRRIGPAYFAVSEPSSMITVLDACVRTRLCAATCVVLLDGNDLELARIHGETKIQEWRWVTSANRYSLIDI